MTQDNSFLDKILLVTLSKHHMLAILSNIKYWFVFKYRVMAYSRRVVFTGHKSSRLSITPIEDQTFETFKE